jgi:DNA-binding transcriptional ArsR family regulator
VIRRVGNVSQEIEQTAKGPLRPRWVTVMDTKWIENISKALADETRLRIFKAIAAKGNLTCGDLANLLAVTPATISHQLKILTHVDLIECHKEGQFLHSRTITIAEYTESLALFSKSTRAVRSAGNK